MVVCIALAALAIPLRSLTVNRAPSAPTRSQMAIDPAIDQNSITTRIHLKLLAPAASFELSDVGGHVLWQTNHLPAGDHSHTIMMPLPPDGYWECFVTADFLDLASETALFITLTPDGMDEQSRFAIGTNRIDEVLDFQWQNRR